MRYWFWLILLTSNLTSWAQTWITKTEPLAARYNFRNIDNNNGLNSNDVYALTQDRKGYIWIGTEKGLQRYDGIRFIDCFNTDAKPGSKKILGVFPDNANNRIFYDQPDRRLRQWDYLTNTSTEIFADSVLRTSPTVIHNYKDWNGQNWTFGIYWMDSSKLNSEGLAIVKVPGEEHAHEVTFIHDEKRRQVWIVDKINGVFLLNGADSTVSSPAHNAGNDPLLTNLKNTGINVHKFASDGHDNIWLITWSDFFYRFNRQAKTMATYSVASILEQQGNQATLPCWVSDILVDDHGALWVATTKAGLLQYDFETDIFHYLLRQPGNNLALQYNTQINVVFQDREENIWLGTDKGICIFNPYRFYFTTISNQDTGKPSSIAVNEISTAALIKKDLWVGSWGGGITVYDTAFHRKGQYFFNKEPEKNMVWSFAELTDGSIWAGCQHGILHMIAANGKLLSTIRPPETESSTIKSMALDKKGNVILGLHNGKVIFYDRQQGAFSAYNTAGQAPSVHLSSVETLFFDHANDHDNDYDHDDNTCWVGTLNGLCKYDIQKKCFIAMYQPFPGYNVRCWGINRYNDSTLIVATENYGLFFFNRHTTTFTRLPVYEENPNWSAYSVETDASGKVWFSTEYTIGNYDPATKKAFVWQPEKGLITTSLKGCYFLHASSGRWITWTAAELLAFLPDQINNARTRAMPVTITGFRVFSNPLFIDSLTTRNLPVDLSYKENFIGIEFSNLQFSDIERTKYYYRLEGVDPDWVYGGTRGLASYTNLPPGNYTFRVKTEDYEGPKGTASLVIRIAAPFWATIWFRMLIVTVAVVIILLLFRWYTHGQQKETRMKQQIATTEMMALRAQMNPHFIFNCINSIDALIQSNDKYHATVYLNKFARLIRNVLDSSKQNTISLARDLETLQLYIDLELFRNDNKFTAEIQVDDGLLNEDYRVPPLIVQPYVENAILHGLRQREGSDGKLTVSVSKKDEHLVFLIEDNGIGRFAGAGSAQHQSYGMEMSRDRVNLFNREEHIPVIITDLESDGHPAGTRVQVSLKLN